jgi:hypothetical protein
MQSKQVSAPASRSIVNYRLTCGFSASVLAAGCIEKGQAAAPAGAALPFCAARGLAGGIFHKRGIRFPRQEMRWI